MNNTLTALKGVKVGHSTHEDKLTGVTFVLFDDYLPVAYKSYGGAPGTYATENLRNGMSFSSRLGLFISGGSLNGLISGASITEQLVAKGIGEKLGKTIMPAVSGAIVWDLGVRESQFKYEYGKEAVDNLSDEPVTGGNIGAGTGVSVGKFSYTNDGLSLGMKSGVGSARVDLGNGIIVCALSVVNALGNVISPKGEILAGNRNDSDTSKFRTFEGSSKFLTGAKMNTTISIVGTNANLKTRENYERIAHIASHGQVRAINPVHTSLDGDTIFVFSTEEVNDFLTPLGQTKSKTGWPELNVDIIGQAAANAVQGSIYDSCNQAETIKYSGAYKGVVPSSKEFNI